jgi:GTPase SAR1 family protein
VGYNKYGETSKVCGYAFLLGFDIWSLVVRITASYYRRAQGVVIVYDVTNEASFEHVETWLQAVNESAPPNAVKALVGTKCDLTSLQVVSTERAQAYADAHGLIFFETSAKTSTNAHKVYEHILHKIVEVSNEEDQKEIEQPPAENKNNNDAFCSLL